NGKSRRRRKARAFPARFSPFVLDPSLNHSASSPQFFSGWIFLDWLSNSRKGDHTAMAAS
ncbi:hypothetical protein Taro_037512, partial [Colocasia esculenta]|nr:hypothetical protein [Colocasia esculenta]